MTFGTGHGHAAVTLGKIPAARPQRIAIELSSPIPTARFREFLDANRVSGPITMLEQDAFRGQRLALCGAGPSLAQETIRGVDQLFACNSALPYLMDRGVAVSGAVGIDQTPGLLREWARTFDVPYYVASSCDPALIQHLRAAGRSLHWFHNAIGIPNELDYYRRAWPHPMFMVGQGMTVVSRFVYLARWMGFERIDVYGADCAFGPDDTAHANGETAETAYRQPVVMEGQIDGRTWRTRPDMLRDAVCLAKMARDMSGTVRLIGDTLPVALLGKDDAFLDQVSRTLAPGAPIPV